MGVYAKSGSYPIYYTANQRPTPGSTTNFTQTTSEGSYGRNGFTNGSRKTRTEQAKIDGYMKPSAFTYVSERIRRKQGGFTYEQKAPYSPLKVYYDDYLASSFLNSLTQGSKADWNYSSNLNNAIASANSKTRDLRHSVGETLAELRKTVDMTTRTMTRVANAADKAFITYRKVRGGLKDPKIIGPMLSEVAQILTTRELPMRDQKRILRRMQRPTYRFDQLWLEYRYGWLPLYSGVYGSMTMLWDQMRARPTVAIVKGNPIESTRVLKSTSPLFGADWQGQGAYQWGLNPATHPMTVSWKITDTLKESSRMIYYIRITSDVERAGAQLGLDNPLLLMWELIPFSFVVDWFANVSDVLNQCGTFTGYTFLNAVENKRFEQTRVGEYQQHSHTSGAMTVNATIKPSWTWQYIAFHRIISTQKPPVGLQLINGVNTTRMIDALALITNVSRSFKGA